MKAIFNRSRRLAAQFSSRKLGTVLLLLVYLIIRGYCLCNFFFNDRIFLFIAIEKPLQEIGR